MAKRMLVPVLVVLAFILITTTPDRAIAETGTHTEVYVMPSGYTYGLFESSGKPGPDDFVVIKITVDPQSAKAPVTIKVKRGRTQVLTYETNDMPELTEMYIDQAYQVFCGKHPNCNRTKYIELVGKEPVTNFE